MAENASCQNEKNGRDDKWKLELSFPAGLSLPVCHAWMEATELLFNDDVVRPIVEGTCPKLEGAKTNPNGLGVTL